MRTKYWSLCSKSEDCAIKCPYAERHWYQRHGYLVGGEYICCLPDMEDCPYYQKQQYEQTSAPAQLQSDLVYEEPINEEV